MVHNSRVRCISGYVFVVLGGCGSGVGFFAALGGGGACLGETRVFVSVQVF